MQHLFLRGHRLRRLIPGAGAFAVILTLIGGGSALAGTMTAVSADAVASNGPAAAGSDPRLLFVEDFENTGTTPVMVDRYTGASGEAYTADPRWINAAECNGIVTSRASSDVSGCTANSALRGFGHVLGQVTGADPETNHVVSAYTNGPRMPADAVQIESRDDFDLGASGRYVSFGVGAAATACNVAHPLLNFLLVDGATEHPVSDRAIDPCSDPRSSSYTVGGQEYRGGEFVSAGGVLFSGSELRWRLRNAQPESNGNDGAIDNVTILDSTPTLENEFAGTPIVGDTGRMTIRVVNTSEYGSKPGWSFREDLPAGLTVAQAPDTATTCTNPTADVPAGAGLVGLRGDLAFGDASCEISFDVASTTPGTYTVDDSNVSDHVGVDLRATASITFAPEQNRLDVTEQGVLTGGNGDIVADLGEQISFVTTVRNGGNVLVRDVAVTGGQGDVTCDIDELAPGASSECWTAPRDVGQDDVDAASIDDTVAVTASSRLGQPVAGTASATVRTTDHAPAAGLDIAPRVVGTEKPAVGDEVSLAVTVTNSGNVTLRDVTTTVAGDTGMTVTCPTDSLRPGDLVDCTVEGSYTVTQADVDHGSVSFTAITEATAPKGQRVTDTASTVQQTVEHAPATAATLRADLVETGNVPVGGDRVAQTVTIRNTGNVTLRDVGASIEDRADLQVSCPATTLAPGSEIVCHVSGTTLTQAEVDDGVFRSAVSVTAVAPAGQSVTAADDTSVAIERAPALQVDVAAHRTGDAALAAPGEHLAVAVAVENTGNTTLSGLSVEIPELAGLSPVCPVDAIAPGVTISCAVDDFVLSQGDVDHGSVTVPAIAVANAPTGDQVDDRDDIQVGLDGASALDLRVTTSADGQTVRAGDRFTVSYAVTNTGTLSTRELQSADGGGSFGCDVEALEPGATTSCTSAEHVVTEAEAETGRVVLLAQVKAQVSRADGVTDEQPGAATVEQGPSTTRAGFVASTATTVEPVWVFSPEIRTVVAAEVEAEAEATTVELAFTGSDVLSIGLPIAFALILIALALFTVVRLRRAAQEDLE